MNIFEVLPIGASWIRIISDSNEKTHTHTIEKREKGEYVIEPFRYERFYLFEVEEKLYNTELRDNLAYKYGGPFTMYFYSLHGMKLLELYNPYFTKSSEESESGNE